jgi:hypothetical protein
MLENRVDRPYNSALVDAMSKEEVRAYLRRHRLLGDPEKEELQCAS